MSQDPSLELPFAETARDRALVIRTCLLPQSVRAQQAG